MRTTRVVLAAAHLDHDPANNRLRNLRSLCQRCHILHDRPYHLAQRWITYRLRYAFGDFFLGVYERRFGSLRWVEDLLKGRPCQPRRVQGASAGLMLVAAKPPPFNSSGRPVSAASASLQQSPSPRVSEAPA